MPLDEVKLEFWNRAWVNGIILNSAIYFIKIVLGFLLNQNRTIQSIAFADIENMYIRLVSKCIFIVKSLKSFSKILIVKTISNAFLL